MAEVAESEANRCTNPGCDQLSTKSCSACKNRSYCSVSCQTTDWDKHKEECDGHLRKTGTSHLAKAEGFHRDKKWVQALRHADIASTKLQQLKDRGLETVQLISGAMSYKFDALQQLGRFGEALECAKERYTLWAMNHLQHSGSMNAALGLIQSCIHDKKYEDAERYARHAYFMIAEMTDNFIPSDQQPKFLANILCWLATAIFWLAQAGGIPSEAQQKAGEEAIKLARDACEIRERSDGIESSTVAGSMSTLSLVLDYFNDVDDD